MSGPAIDEGRRGDGAVATLVKGALVGIANIIPGVSGGTFALILGIFDRLIRALNSLGLGTLRASWRLVAGGFGKEARAQFASKMRESDMAFLVLLAVGAAASILSSSFLVDYLLDRHYSPTLAFFVGLILPSVAVPWAMMDRRGLVLLWAIPGVALTVGVSLVMPEGAAGSDSALVAAGAGALAISAMILPGISGSYVLLVLGQYQNALAKVTGLQRGIAEGHLDVDAAIWLAAMALGMAAGILLFARLLGFLFARFRSATLAFLVGLLLGSLWVLWPFKEISAGAEVVDRQGEVKEEVRIATAPNRLPRSAGEGLVALGAFAVGLAGSAGLIAMGRRARSAPGRSDS